MDFPIDIVFTWVDGNDPDWQMTERKFRNQSNGDSGINRFRDYGLLKNAIERVLKFAPWVHRVFLITANQAPKWARENSKIVTVDHRDFIDSQYLPTFNSNAIEMNIWRIPTLSEHFILFNDDFFLTQSVTKEDFFTNEGLPVLDGSMHIVQPLGDFSRIIFNNMVIVNELYPKSKFLRGSFFKHFNFRYGLKGNIRSTLASPYKVWTGFFEDHLAYPHLKSWFKKLYEDHPLIFDQTSSHRFRCAGDFSHWLLKNLYIASGNFEPRHLHFGQEVTLSRESDLTKIKPLMLKHKMIVLNDNILESEANRVIPLLQKIMEEY
ncbi:Stealth CR1 domain-containing protein [Lacticaseibacillus paracasei]|uniref:Stealth CR1 domain-containing protein n=1 Tax=Lacticaseibacillus paracasei TaxID=1597 RepID=UPI0026E0FE69|nr:Stealth CR1 domain-containing protein [Lacticaseibacillus paracasei]MDO5967925.1 Stealth CR1 domain-containing protein [Lacticaseibacillus paracasei]